MKYIVDFDHVLFDYDAYMGEVANHGLDDVFVDPVVWDTLQPADFLYEDAIPFLQQFQKSDVAIVSATSPKYGPNATTFQERKIAESGIGDFVTEIVLVEGEKGPDVCALANGEAVFIDDKMTNHESVKEMCPAVHCIQVLRPIPRRIGKNPMSDRDDIPVALNFDEVNKILDSWKLR